MNDSTISHREKEAKSRKTIKTQTPLNAVENTKTSNKRKGQNVENQRIQKPLQGSQKKKESGWCSKSAKHLPDSS
ncbi:hypothetical protein PL394_07575 [Bifidobacterium adolescentis]|nr:hypothetical protein [Bifidobacterium adolescentis]